MSLADFLVSDGSVITAALHAAVTGYLLELNNPVVRDSAMTKLGPVNRSLNPAGRADVSTLTKGLLRVFRVHLLVVVRAAGSSAVALHDALTESIGDIRVACDSFLKPQRTAPGVVLAHLAFPHRSHALLKMRGRSKRGSLRTICHFKPSS